MVETATARFSMVVAGVLIEQDADGHWYATESPQAYGCTSAEEVKELTLSDLRRDTLENMGYAWDGSTIAELIVTLITRTRAYRETISAVCGPPMKPIVNQGWCPDVDEHQPHIQCGECNR